MAIYDLSVRMVDAYGRGKTKRFELTEVDFDTALLSAVGVVADLVAVSKLGTVAYSLGQRVTAVNAPSAGANIDEGATITAMKADGDKAPLRVPCPIEACRNTDGTIDLAQGDMAGFLANWTSGNVLISDGETVTSFVSGKLDK